MASYNGLSEAEEERFAIWLEEMGENQQVLGKIFRHGTESFNPFDPDKVTNRIHLTKEVGDALIAIELMLRAGDIDPFVMINHIKEKVVRMRKYVHAEENLMALPVFQPDEAPFISLSRFMNEDYEYLAMLGYKNRNTPPCSKTTQELGPSWPARSQSSVSPTESVDSSTEKSP